MERVLVYRSSEWLQVCMGTEPELAPAITTFRDAAKGNALQVVSKQDTDHDILTFWVQMEHGQALREIMIEARWLVEKNVAMCVYLAISNQLGRQPQEERQTEMLLAMLRQLMVAKSFSSVSRLGIIFTQSPTADLAQGLRRVGFTPSTPAFEWRQETMPRLETWWVVLSTPERGLILM